MPKKLRDVRCRTCGTTFEKATYTIDADKEPDPDDLIKCRLCGSTNIEVSREYVVV